MGSDVAVREDGFAACGLVADGVSSAHSKRAYARALSAFIEWHRDTGARGLSKAVVQAYRAELEARSLAPSTINLAMSAIRKLAQEAGDNGLLAADVVAGIQRVKGVKHSGVRIGNWLTQDEAEGLLSLPDPASVIGVRDRALLALLVGAGLRRTEAAGLEFEQMQQREGRWVIADIVGKGQRVRTVPIPGWVKTAIDCWAERAGLSSGPVFRWVDKAGRIRGARLSPQAIFNAVRRYSANLGVSVAPHDLRRTFAKLAHRGRAPLEQIQFSLGHASLLTTERYLGLRQDLGDAPCDHLGLRVPARDGR